VHSLGLLHARAGDYKSALAHNFEALKARRGRAIEEWETWGNIVELRLQPNMPPFGSADGDDTLLSKIDELAEQLLAHSDPDRALRAHYYGLQLLGYAPHDGPDGVIYRWAERAVSQAESVWAAVADPLVRYHLGRWLGTFYATRLLLGIRRGESADVLLRFAQNGKARTLLLDRQSGQNKVPWEVDCASLTKRLRQSQGSAFIELGISSLGTAALVAYLGRDAELVIETKVLEFREEELVGLLTKPERGWLPYLEALKKADAASQIEKLEACSAAMERILAILHERLLGPVTAGLRSQGVQDLVFSVHGPLAAFPLAATWRTVDGEPRYLIEEFRSISLSPSVTTFVYAEQPRPITTCQYVLGNTRELPREASSDGQRLESIWRRSFTVAAPLKNPSPDEFLQSLDQIDLIHAVCHGEFDPWQLDKSGIQVGGDALLSCARILAEVACKRTALVVLCACRSGRSRSEDFGAEWLGLSGVLLRRGVQSVLAALWDVDYTASFHLSCEFFKHLIDRQQPVAIAASEAMRALLITGRSAKHNADAHWFLEGRDQTLIPRLRRLLDSPWLWACMQSVSVAT
jgi:CHAT domain-containing protein